MTRFLCGLFRHRLDNNSRTWEWQPNVRSCWCGLRSVRWVSTRLRTTYPPFGQQLSSLRLADVELVPLGGVDVDRRP